VHLLCPNAVIPHDLDNFSAGHLYRARQPSRGAPLPIDGAFLFSGQLFSRAGIDIGRTPLQSIQTRPVESTSRPKRFQNNTGEDEMPIITVVLTLLVVGVLLWLINTYIPMQSTIKGLLNAVIVILLIIWLLNVFGLMHYVTDFKVGQH